MIPRSEAEMLVRGLARLDPSNPLLWETEEIVTKFLSAVYQIMNGMTGESPEPETVKAALRKRFLACLARRQWFWDADVLFAVWEEATRKPVCPVSMRKGLREALNRALRTQGLIEKK